MKPIEGLMFEVKPVAQVVLEGDRKCIKFIGLNGYMVDVGTPLYTRAPAPEQAEVLTALQLAVWAMMRKPNDAWKDEMITKALEAANMVLNKEKQS